MSAHSKPHSDAASPHIVVGDGKHHRKPIKLHLKVWGMGLLCLVILIGVTVGTYKLIKAIHKPDKSHELSTANNSENHHGEGTVQQPQVTTYDMALSEADKGNVAGAQDMLSKQLAGATSSEKKVEIYNEMMTVALNAKQYDSAIELGKTADGLKPTSNTAQLVYAAYLAKGDTINAKKWLQQAISRLDPSSPDYGMMSDSLNEKLSELQ